MKGTVLIVEDDEIVRSRMGATLRGMGLEVRTAENGLEALSAAVIEKPDLILLDLFMPHLGGYSVCRELSREPSTARIPIVIVSAHAEPHHREKAAQLGARGYLAKPFQDDDLERLVRSLMEGEASPSAG